MFQFLSIGVILQIFCLYHAYKNNADTKWFWFIIFFPLIGGGFYLYHHFYSKENIQNVSEGIKGIVNSNYEIEKLEQQLKKTDSDLNKSLLADKYLEIGRVEEAISLYEACISDGVGTQNHILMSLVKANYKTENYAQAVSFAEQLNGQIEFQKSEEKVAFGWSLFHLGEMDKANSVFSEMDSRFTNYKQRLEYARFMEQTNKKEQAVSFVNGLLDEFDQMLPDERRQKRAVHRSIKNYLMELSKS